MKRALRAMPGVQEDGPPRRGPEMLQGGYTRRRLLALLTPPVVGSALAACRAGAARPQPGEAPRPAALEIWSPTMNPEQTAVQEQVLREFEERYPHLTARLTVIPGGWDPVVEKLTLAVSGGVPPNASRLPDNPIRLLIFEGVLTPLTPLMQRERFSTRGLDQGMLDRATMEGTLYALPWSGGMLALYYNQDLFERAGVPLPETTRAMNWERFIEAAVRVRALGEDVWGFRVGGNLETPSWDTVKEWLPWLWSNGNDYFDKTETRPLFGDEKGIASVQLLTDLMRKYRAAPGPGMARPAPATGKVGMWVSQSGDIVTMQQQAPGVRFGCSLIPIGPGGTKSYGVQGGSFIAIPRGAKDLDPSWRYLKWVTDEAVNLRLVTPAFQDPVHMSNRTKPPFADIPQYQAFVEQFKTARARPGNPVYRLTEENTAAELQAAYRGEKSPAEAVRTAVERAIAIIQQHQQTRR